MLLKEPLQTSGFPENVATRYMYGDKSSPSWTREDPHFDYLKVSAAVNEPGLPEGSDDLTYERYNILRHIEDRKLIRSSLETFGCLMSISDGARFSDQD